MLLFVLFLLISGFKVWDVGCCGVNKIGQCVHSKRACQNRSEYVFWDSFHPTEASNLITANRVYKAHDPSDSHPMDISNLVRLFGHTDSHLLADVSEQATKITSATY